MGVSKPLQIIVPIGTRCTTVTSLSHRDWLSANNIFYYLITYFYVRAPTCVYCISLVSRADTRVLNCFSVAAMARSAILHTPPRFTYVVSRRINKLWSLHDSDPHRDRTTILGGLSIYLIGRNDRDFEFVFFRHLSASQYGSIPRAQVSASWVARLMVICA